MSRITIAALTVLLAHSAQAADLPAYDGGEALAQPGAGDQARVGMGTFATCQRAIAEWAEPFAPIDIETVSVGPVQRQFNGTRIAPLFVRIVYETEAGRETRKARVRCTIDRRDMVAVQLTE